MQKFRAGQMVRVARKLQRGDPPENRCCWKDQMDEQVGQIREVVEYSGDRHRTYRLKGCVWYFWEGCLEPAFYGNEED